MNLDRELPVDPDFLHAGWTSWLPAGSLFAHAAIRRAGRLKLQGDLDYLWKHPEIMWVNETCGSLDASTAVAYISDSRSVEEQIQLDDFRTGRVNRACEAAGMASAVTVRDAMELMRRLGLLTRTEDTAIRWSDVSPLPLPEDRILMTDRERACEADLRWSNLAWRTGYGLLKFFRAASIDNYTGSLRDLSTRTSLDLLSLRHALMSLQQNKWIVASTDLERIEPWALLEFEVSVRLAET